MDRFELYRRAGRELVRISRFAHGQPGRALRHEYRLANRTYEHLPDSGQCRTTEPGPHFGLASVVLLRRTISEATVVGLPKTSTFRNSPPNFAQPCLTPLSRRSGCLQWPAIRLQAGNASYVRLTDPTGSRLTAYATVEPAAEDPLLFAKLQHGVDDWTLLSELHYDRTVHPGRAFFEVGL